MSPDKNGDGDGDDDDDDQDQQNEMACSNQLFIRDNEGEEAREEEIPNELEDSNKAQGFF